MADEIKLEGYTTGQTLLARIKNSLGQIRTASSTFVATTSILTTNWGATVRTVALTEQLDGNGVPSGCYLGNFDTTINTADDYTVEIIASPSTSGSAVVAVQPISWDGTKAITPSSINAAIAALSLPVISDAVQPSPSPTATGFSGSGALSSTTGAYVNMAILFTSGANRGFARKVVAYNAAGNVITLDLGLPVAPSNGDTFDLIGYSA